MQGAAWSIEGHLSELNCYGNERFYDKENFSLNIRRKELIKLEDSRIKETGLNAEQFSDRRKKLVLFSWD